MTEISRESSPLSLSSALSLYQVLLEKWQRKINLVSPDTLNDLEGRHFRDSLQLAALIPDGTKTLLDLGSGAGFPGMVLALARPEIDVYLLDSDEKKCEFLRTISRETRRPVNVLCQRIESPLSLIPDVITARALAPLPKILDYVRPFFHVNQNLILILPKGKNWQAEVDEASKSFGFYLEHFPSETSEEAQILRLSHVHVLDDSRETL